MRPRHRARGPSGGGGCEGGGRAPGSGSWGAPQSSGTRTGSAGAPNAGFLHPSPPREEGAAPAPGQGREPRASTRPAPRAHPRGTFFLSPWGFNPNLASSSPTWQDGRRDRQREKTIFSSRRGVVSAPRPQPGPRPAPDPRAQLVRPASGSATRERGGRSRGCGEGGGTSSRASPSPSQSGADQVLTAKPSASPASRGRPTSNCKPAALFWGLEENRTPGAPGTEHLSNAPLRKQAGSALQGS